MRLARRHLLWNAALLTGAAIGLAPVHAQAATAPALRGSDQPPPPPHGHEVSRLDPSSGADQTAALQAAIDRAAAEGAVLHVPAGVYYCGRLVLPGGARISGVHGATRLKFLGSGGFVTASHASGLALDGLILDGNSQPLDGTGGEAAADGLVTLTDCHGIGLRRLTVLGGLANGISLRGCSGVVAECTISDCGGTGLFSLDARDLSLTGNAITRIGNNGIQVWRHAAGEDGTLVAHNRVSHIEARGGGDGPNGNGINIFRAGSVQVLGNRVSDCAFSAIRGNSSSNIQIIANSCERLGEVAIYAEFAFEGAVISDNIVDHAALGISVTNFNDGGRLAVVQGNLLRNFKRKSASGEDLGTGIAIEADSAVCGNVIENAERIGILAGWGAYRRDIAITGNVVRGAPVGIGIAADAHGGAVLVAQNLLSGASAGSIMRMDGAEPTGPDLAAAGQAAGITISGNVSA